MTGVLGELLLARQPILDVHADVVGYQLLHRSVAAPTGAGRADDTSLLVDGVLTLGRQQLTGGADAWVTVTDELLRRGTVLGLPAEGIVLGVPAGVTPDEGLRGALAAHQAAGYGLFLDEVVVGDPRLALLDLVDHVRVDLVPETLGVGLALIGEIAGRGTGVLAAHVETHEQHRRVTTLGAGLVQGLFWTQPRQLRAVRPLQFAPGHLELLDELSEQEVDLRAVEALIRSDLTLTDRFLHLIRRVAGYREVRTIHDGLVLLGVRAVQRWVSVLTLGSVTDDAPVELVTLASARARGCELLEEMRGGRRALEAFSLGMFSVLGEDGVLTSAALDALPVSDDVRAALEHRRGPLRSLLDVELAAERGAFEVAEDAGRSMGVEPGQLARVNAAALQWSAAVCA